MANATKKLGSVAEFFNSLEPVLAHAPGLPDYWCNADVSTVVPEA
jgi:hypothetical protein